MVRLDKSTINTTCALFLFLVSTYNGLVAWTWDIKFLDEFIIYSYTRYFEFYLAENIETYFFTLPPATNQIHQVSLIGSRVHRDITRSRMNIIIFNFSKGHCPDWSILTFLLYIVSYLQHTGEVRLEYM